MVTRIYQIPSEIWGHLISQLDSEYHQNATKKRCYKLQSLTTQAFTVLKSVKFGLRTAKIGLKILPTQWAAITLAIHSTVSLKNTHTFVYIFG